MAAAAALNVAALATAGAACIAGGRAAQRFRLPQITGCLVAGMAVGPAGLGLISARLLARLVPVEAACLAAIALAAGAELHLAELQRTRRQVSFRSVGRHSASVMEQQVRGTSTACQCTRDLQRPLSAQYSAEKGMWYLEHDAHAPLSRRRCCALRRLSRWPAGWRWAAACWRRRLRCHFWRPWNGESCGRSPRWAGH